MSHPAPPNPTKRSGSDHFARLLVGSLSTLVFSFAAIAAPAPVQEQVPIPGLSLEESVRLETASQKLRELSLQRQQRNEVRGDEINKLIQQVEESATSGDHLRYQTARERLISYIFAANNKDHRDLNSIIHTVKETQVLTARARIAIEKMVAENQEESGLSNLIDQSQDQFQASFIEPNQRETVLVSSLLASETLSSQEEERLKHHLDQLVNTNAIFESWGQPLLDIPYLPTQIDPAFDKKEAVVFLEDLNRHLRFDYKDLEVQLFWSEVLAQIGQRYAEGKLPLVRVQSALHRLSNMAGDTPQGQGKPWFMGALDELAQVQVPSQPPPWKMQQRTRRTPWSKTTGSPTTSAAPSNPEALLDQIHRSRTPDETP